MFIDALIKQNPALLDVAKSLLQTGAILPDTYVLDVDQILTNAKLMAEEAERHNIKLYFMTKQLGRNPWLIKQILDATDAGIVTVDFKEAESLLHAGIHVDHLGHLVQVPERMLEYVLQHRPEVITVYSLEKAKSIDTTARKLKIVQPILIKIAEKGDLLYPSQEAGFSLEALPNVLQELKHLENIEIIGVTHFPCLQWQAATDQTLPTQNLHSLMKSAEILREVGIEPKHINAPSAASSTTFATLASFGVTHTEPGHSLTGTMPGNHAGTEPEKIAIVYASEISHNFAGDSYCYGGGVYRRGNLHNALIYQKTENLSETNQHQYVQPQYVQPERAEVLPIDATSIDYHIGLKGEYDMGSAVLMSFRTQIFVTRSDVAMVTGLQTGEPKLAGIFDSQGQFKCSSYLDRFAKLKQDQLKNVDLKNAGLKNGEQHG